MVCVRVTSVPRFAAKERVGSVSEGTAPNLRTSELSSGLHPSRVDVDVYANNSELLALVRMIHTHYLSLERRVDGRIALGCCENWSTTW
jgi:hypothetical protein